MPDIVVRHIDDITADRIKTLARERRWSINDVVLHALRAGLGLAAADSAGERDYEVHDIAHLTGTWCADETAAFQEAMDALADAQPDHLVAAARHRD